MKIPIFLLFLPICFGCFPYFSPGAYLRLPPAPLDNIAWNALDRDNAGNIYAVGSLRRSETGYTCATGSSVPITFSANVTGATFVANSNFTDGAIAKFYQNGSLAYILSERVSAAGAIGQEEYTFVEVDAQSALVVAAGLARLEPESKYDGGQIVVNIVRVDGTPGYQFSGYNDASRILALAVNGTEVDLQVYVLFEANTMAFDNINVQYANSYGNTTAPILVQYDKWGNIVRATRIFDSLQRTPFFDNHPYRLAVSATTIQITMPALFSGGTFVGFTNAFPLPVEPLFVGNNDKLIGSALITFDYSAGGETIIVDICKGAQFYTRTALDGTTLGAFTVDSPMTSSNPAFAPLLANLEIQATYVAKFAGPGFSAPLWVKKVPSNLQLGNAFGFSANKYNTAARILFATSYKFLILDGTTMTKFLRGMFSPSFFFSTEIILGPSTFITGIEPDTPATIKRITLFTSPTITQTSITLPTLQGDTFDRSCLFLPKYPTATTYVNVSVPSLPSFVSFSQEPDPDLAVKIDSVNFRTGLTTISFMNESDTIPLSFVLARDTVYDPPAIFNITLTLYGEYSGTFTITVNATDYFNTKASVQRCPIDAQASMGQGQRYFLSVGVHVLPVASWMSGLTNITFTVTPSTHVVQTSGSISTLTNMQSIYFDPFIFSYEYHDFSVIGDPTLITTLNMSYLIQSPDPELNGLTASCGIDIFNYNYNESATLSEYPDIIHLESVQQIQPLFRLRRLVSGYIAITGYLLDLVTGQSFPLLNPHNFTNITEFGIVDGIDYRLDFGDLSLANMTNFRSQVYPHAARFVVDITSSDSDLNNQQVTAKISFQLNCDPIIQIGPSRFYSALRPASSILGQISIPEGSGRMFELGILYCLPTQPITLTCTSSDPLSVPCPPAILLTENDYLISLGSTSPPTYLSIRVNDDNVVDPSPLFAHNVTLSFKSTSLDPNFDAYAFNLLVTALDNDAPLLKLLTNWRFGIEVNPFAAFPAIHAVASCSIDGSVAVVGSFDATVVFGNSSILLTSMGGTDGFVAVLDPYGVLRWIYTLGTVGANDRVLHVVYDENCDIYVSGDVSNLNQDENLIMVNPTNRTMPMISSNQLDTFVIKYTGSSGVIMWYNWARSVGFDVSRALTYSNGVLLHSGKMFGCCWGMSNSTVVDPNFRYNSSTAAPSLEIQAEWFNYSFPSVQPFIYGVSPGEGFLSVIDSTTGNLKTSGVVIIGGPYCEQEIVDTAGDVANGIFVFGTTRHAHNYDTDLDSTASVLFGPPGPNRLVITRPSKFGFLARSKPGVEPLQFEWAVTFSYVQSPYDPLGTGSDATFTPGYIALSQRTSESMVYGIANTGFNPRIMNINLYPSGAQIAQIPAESLDSWSGFSVFMFYANNGTFGWFGRSTQSYTVRLSGLSVDSNNGFIYVTGSYHGSMQYQSAFLGYSNKLAPFMLCINPQTGTIRWQARPQIADQSSLIRLSVALGPLGQAIFGGNQLLSNLLGASNVNASSNIQGGQAFVVDASLPGVYVNPTLLSVRERNTTTFTVRLTASPRATVQIRTFTSDFPPPAPLVAPPFRNTLNAPLVFTLADWSILKTFTLSAIDNIFAQETTAFPVNVDVSSTDTNYHQMYVPPIKVSITDDNDPSTVLFASPIVSTFAAYPAQIRAAFLSIGAVAGEGIPTVRTTALDQTMFESLSPTHQPYFVMSANGLTGDLYFTPPSSGKTGSSVVEVVLQYPAPNYWRTTPVTFTIVVQPTPPPLISAVFPPSSPVFGGVSITIYGSRISDGRYIEGPANITALSLAGVPCAASSVSWISPSSVKCTSGVYNGTTIPFIGPIGMTLVPGVPLQSPLTQASTVSFAYVNTPVIASITPSSGPARIRTRVTITGLSLGLAQADIDTVTIGGVPCTLLTWISPSQLSCTTGIAPGYNAVALVRVVAFSSGDSSTGSSPVVTYEYQASDVRALNPVRAPAYLPTNILIDLANYKMGTNDSILAVRVGPTPCASFFEIASTSGASVVCAMTAPTLSDYPSALAATSNLTLDVVVETNAGGLSRSSTGVKFTWYYPAPQITGLVPASAQVLGGGKITILGSFFGRVASEFSAATVVSLPCSSSAVWFNSSAIVCVIPDASATLTSGFVDGPVTLTSLPGFKSSSAPLMFTYYTSLTSLPPRIFQLSPSSGSYLGGYTVTIIGQSFGSSLSDITSVTVNGVSCLRSARYISVSLVSCTVPTMPAPTVGPVSLSTRGGPPSTPAVLFSFVYPSPQFTGVFPRQGLRTGGDSITVVGNFFGETAPVAGLSFGVYMGTFQATCSNPVWLSPSTIKCFTPPQSSAGEATPVFSSEAVASHLLGFQYVDATQICNPRCGYNAECINKNCVCTFGFTGPTCDTPVILVTIDTPITTEDGAAATALVSIAFAPTSNVVIPVFAPMGSEVVVDKLSLTFTPSNWDTPQQVKIIGVYDMFRDGNVTAPVIFDKATSLDTRFNGYSVGTRFITNMDSSPRILSIQPTIIPLNGTMVTMVVTNLDSSFQVIFQSSVDQYLVSLDSSVMNVTAIDSVRVTVSSSSGDTIVTQSAYQIIFRAPAMKAPGYKGVVVVNRFGTSGSADNLAFYSDDCPFVGFYGRGSDCQPCPEGAVCPGGYRLWPLEGWWNTGEDSGFVKKCKPGRCIGGPKSLCAPTYEGSLCGECIDGYTMVAEVCAKCPDPAPFVGIFIANFAVWGVVSFACWFFEDRDMFNMVLSVVLALQNLAGIGQTVDGDMPRLVANTYDVLYLFSGDLGFLKPDCLGQVKFESDYFASLAYNCLIGFPMVLGVFLFRTISPWWHRRRGTGRDQERYAHYHNRMIRSMMVWLSVIYYSVIKTALSAFACVRTGKTWVLEGFSEYECYTPRHIGIMVFSLVLLISIGLLFPVLYYFRIVRGRTNQELTDHTYGEKWDIYYEPFRVKHRNFWISEVLVSVGNALAGSVLLSENLVQFVLLVVLAGMGFIYILVFRPYRRVLENGSQAAIYLANIVMVVLVFNSRKNALSTKRRRDLSWFLLAIVFLDFILIVAVSTYYMIRRAFFKDNHHKATTNNISPKGSLGGSGSQEEMHAIADPIGGGAAEDDNMGEGAGGGPSAIEPIAAEGSSHSEQEINHNTSIIDDITVLFHKAREYLFPSASTSSGAPSEAMSRSASGDVAT